MLTQKNKIHIRLVLFVFAMAAVAAPGAAVASISFHAADSVLGKSVVAVDLMHYESEKIRPGCGVVIDENGTLLVDKMLFREVISADVTTASGKTRPISGVFGQNQDLGLWKASIEELVGENTPKMPYARFAEKSPETGDTVMVLDPRHRDRGFIHGRVIKWKGKFNIQLNEKISPAMKGAPVFNINGRLCGILTDINIKKPSPYGWVAPVTMNTGFAESEPLSIPEWKLKLDEEWRASKKGMWHAATYHLISKEYESAVPVLENIIKKDGADINAHVQLGHCLARLGRFTESIEVYEALVKLEPGSGNYFNLGQACAAAGQYEKAVTATQKALDLDAENHNARYNLGVIYLSMGNTEAALAEKKVLTDKAPELAARLAEAEKNIVPVSDAPSSAGK